MNMCAFNAVKETSETCSPFRPLSERFKSHCAGACASKFQEAAVEERM